MEIDETTCSLQMPWSHRSLVSLPESVKKARANPVEVTCVAEVTLLYKLHNTFLNNWAPYVL